MTDPRSVAQAGQKSTMVGNGRPKAARLPFIRSSIGRSVFRYHIRDVFAHLRVAGAPKGMGALENRAGDCLRDGAK